MMVNEISMMDLTSLSTINNQCKIAKSENRSSLDLASLSSCRRYEDDLRFSANKVHVSNNCSDD
jgi:hypothetical protein